jgi:hypothetical protein
MKYGGTSQIYGGVCPHAAHCSECVAATCGRANVCWADDGDIAAT